MSSLQSSLFDRLRAGVVRLSVVSIFSTFILLFSGTYILMRFAEPGKPIAEFGNFLWFFVVTSFTVGYGDLFPVTDLGRVAAFIVMFCGIGLFAVGAAKGADKIFQLHSLRRRGLLDTFETNHIVILGYVPGKSELLVKEIRNDVSYKETAIVLCAPPSSLRENPFLSKDNVQFVSGSLTDPETLRKAALGSASRVIIFTESDDTTFSAAISAEHLVDENAHIAAFVNDAEKIQLLARVAPHIECVPLLAIPMLVQAIQDPGSSALILDLVENGGAINQFRTNVPTHARETTFAKLLIVMKNEKNAILIGLSNSHDSSAPVKANPPAETAIGPGTSIFYISSSRITETELMDLMNQ